jgi:hypothetical protein
VGGAIGGAAHYNGWNGINGTVYIIIIIIIKHIKHMETTFDCVPLIPFQALQ